MAHVVVMDKSKPKPGWIDGGRYGGKHGAAARAYYQRIWQCQPAWANRDMIRAIYHAAGNLRAQGYDVEVDHIVPLRNPLVCGLHVPRNLRIVDRRENQFRSNKHWPDMPFEQPDLFAHAHAHIDFELQSQ